MKIEFETGDFVENVKRKAWEVKHDAEIKVNEAINWGKQNPQVVITMIPVAAKVCKEAYKYVTKQKELNDLERRFWDPRMGRYARSKRRLSKQEANYAERQFKAGRTYRDILDEMGLLER